MYSAATTLLKDLGIFDKMKIANITHGEQQDALADGMIDGYAIYVAPPGASVSEMAVKNDIRLLDLKEVMAKMDFFKKYPYFTREIIPAGSYKGVDYSVATFGDMEFLVAHKDVDEKMVYEATKLWFSPKGVSFLTTVHKSLAEMGKPDPTNGLYQSIPLHPGAEKVWREKGITIRKFK
jgi:TRAP transporter TAXI family solute receptor